MLSKMNDLMGGYTVIVTTKQDGEISQCTERSFHGRTS